MNAHTPFDAKKDWSNPYCQNSSNDQIVDALLGNAYHVVRTVYCNLGNIKFLYDFLNQYGVVLCVQSEAELKAISTDAKYVRIYGFSHAGDRQVTDYLYVDGDRTGIIPDDSEATGSWVTVATSGASGGGTSPGGAYIPWVYANGSATGGETTINVPDGTVGVPFIIINGDMQYVGRGFEFNIDDMSVTLAQPLEEGDEVVFLLTGTPAVPDNPNVTDWVQINWLYNGGYAVGGEQVIAIPYTFESVPAIYKNGERYYAGLADKSYTVDAANQRILLTEPLVTNDRLIITIGGESTTLIMTDRTVQEVARSVNVQENEVILSTNTTQYLNGKKVIYDVVGQKIYSLPTLPSNVYINSVSNGQLTYSPDNITVTLLPTHQEQIARWRDDGDIRGWGAKGDGSDDTSAINAAGLDLSSAGGGVLKWPSGQYSYTFSPPPHGVMWDMDGPNIQREKLGGSPGAEFQTAKFTYMPGPHPTKQLHAHHIRAISKGSNAIGAPYADYALGLTIEKEHWSESSGTPSAGEINGLMIFTRNGCLTSDPVKTGGAAILADIGQTKGSGYTQFAEIVNSVFAKGTFGLTKQTNLQLLGIDEKSGDSWGAVLNSVVGSQSGCFRLVGTDAAPWNYIIQSWKNSAHVYYLSDLGKHRWRVNGVSMSLEQDSSTGAMVMRNELGSAVEWTTPSGSASLRAINVQSGTAYTINTAEITGDLNKTLVMGNASAITVTLPANAPSGFHCEVIQRDPGQVTFVTASGATLQNVDGHTKTKGQHAVVRLRVRGNGNGQSAIWVLDGSTAA